ncbi:MAG: hypothetical protein A2Y38_01175 [Spirochaetes bacterium GWB1_59_5]|nr:MAG: hypothetical protein A2Y38_01175 [Spirochaetes bacterium GWB1_59_5]
MIPSSFHARRSAPIAAFLFFAAVGAAVAQGGGQGGGQGFDGSGSGAGVPGGGNPVAPEPTTSNPSGAGGGASKAPEAAGRTGKEHRAVSGAVTDTPTDSLGKEFDLWLATSKEGARLGSVYERLRKTAAPALTAGVPLEAFKARVREAAAKGAPPDIVAAALEADAARWIWLSNLVRDGSWPPVKTAAGFYLSAASALRNGVSEAAVSDLVTWAKATRAGAEKAGAALTVAAALSAALGTRGGQSDSVARIMATSRLKIGQYDAVTALAYRALATGVNAERFLTVLESTVGQGQPLIDFEKALFP